MRNLLLFTMLIFVGSSLTSCKKKDKNNIISPVVVKNIQLLQTTDNSITTALRGCGSNNITNSADYARLYDLKTLGYTSFQVSKVSFAVHGFKLGTATNFPVSVKVYASTAGTADAGLMLIGEEKINITSAMVNTIVEVPFSKPAAVTSTQMLIVVSVPDGTSTQSGFFIGGNNKGQTAAGYVKASVCGATSLTDYSSIGESNNLVLFPTGDGIK